MTPEEALAWLVRRRYFVANEVGWHHADKPPESRDLARYVLAVKTLGAWSVGGSRVDVSTGSATDEVLFRLVQR